MRTVDALIHARDMFLSDPKSWTRGALHAKKAGKDCYCALGGISLVTGCIAPDGTRAPGVAVSCTSGPHAADVRPENTGYGDSDFYGINQLPAKTLLTYQRRGVHLKAALGAVRYLTAAVRKLYGEDVSIVVVNDHGGTYRPARADADGSQEAYNYGLIIRAFNLAIRNAKRRHINGDRKKAVAQTVSL